MNRRSPFVKRRELFERYPKARALARQIEDLQNETASRQSFTLPAREAGLERIGLRHAVQKDVPGANGLQCPRLPVSIKAYLKNTSMVRVFV